MKLATTFFVLATAATAVVTCAGAAELNKSVPGGTTAANPAPQNSSGPQVSEPIYPLTVPATLRSDALMKARVGAGRADPFVPYTGVSKIAPFSVPAIKALKPLPKIHVPPPPKFSNSGLTPPPPPTAVSTPGMAMESVGQAGSGSMEKDLPEPPEKPLIAQKMKLIGLIGDKAFFTFTDLDLKRSNKFPSTVILKNGEQFESVNVVSIEPNSVVLEEDGERFTKELERIR